MPEYRIGCAGWSYRDWVGPVYPSRLPPGKWLEHYAQLFPIVEIDSTFYAMPSDPTVAGWIDRTRNLPGFTFCAKVPQDVTHKALPKGDREAARQTLGTFVQRVLKPLEGVSKLDAVLVQLPPSFAMNETVGDVDATTGLLQVLSALAPSERRVAVEFRHASWFEHVGERLSADVAEAMAAANVGLVQSDGLGFQFTQTRTTPWTYFRLHGRRTEIPPSERGLSHAPYNYLYPKPEIQEIAAKIQARAALDIRTIVIFNNHYRGKAAKNALELMDAMGLPRPKKASLAARESRLEEFNDVS